MAWLEGRTHLEPADLAAVLPSVLLAYYIYRYRYLEIIIEESLVVVTFATVVLTVYVFGIRTIGDWMTRRYGATRRGPPAPSGALRRD